LQPYDLRQNINKFLHVHGESLNVKIGFKVIECISIIISKTYAGDEKLK
jgi:hypothetical protein